MLQCGGGLVVVGTGVAVLGEWCGVAGRFGAVVFY